MSRKRWGALLCLSGFAWVSAALFSAPADPAQPAACADCEMPTFAYDLNEDPRVVQANFEAYEERFRAYLARKRETRRQQRLLKMKEWRGTTIGAKPDSAEMAIHSRIAPLFRHDTPAPAQRRAEFDWCFDGKTEYAAVGWHGVIESAAPNRDGWEVVINVRPLLMHPVHLVPFCGQFSLETWQVSSEGNLTYVRTAPSDPRHRGPDTILTD
jgi:hypothetical protein